MELLEMYLCGRCTVNWVHQGYPAELNMQKVLHLENVLNIHVFGLNVYHIIYMYMVTSNLKEQIN